MKIKIQLSKLYPTSLPLANIFNSEFSESLLISSVNTILFTEINTNNEAVKMFIIKIVLQIREFKNLI